MNNTQEKFISNKPLFNYISDYYPDKYVIKYQKFEPPKIFNLYDAPNEKKLNLDTIGKIIFRTKMYLKIQVM